MKHEHSAGVITYFYVPDLQQIQYLILHYPSGHWDFPKGKIERNETEIEAAVREVHEETGLSISIDHNFRHCLSYFYKNKDGRLVSKEVVFFVGQATTQQVVLSFEHQDYQWLTYTAAQQQLTYRNAQELLALAHDYLKECYI